MDENPTAYPYGVGIASLSAPARDGYTFGGWYSDEALTKAVTSISTTDIGDQTLYAKWTANTPEPADTDYKNCAKDTTCPTAKFADVDPEAWYHDGIHYCVQNGYMIGNSATKFGPDKTLTRAMVVTILYRMEGEPAFMNENLFTDVKSGAWYENAIVWANGKDIVFGYGDGKLGPNDPVTREQLAAILYRYAKYKECDVAAAEETDLSGFGDTAAVSSWAVTTMKWACGSEIIKGIDNNLAAKETSTRAQAASMIQRFCENVIK